MQAEKKEENFRKDRLAEQERHRVAPHASFVTTIHESSTRHRVHHSPLCAGRSLKPGGCGRVKAVLEQYHAQYMEERNKLAQALHRSSNYPHPL
eukprot:3397050-Rhodomonas_salina.2